jgi:hypothetical protein
VLFQLRKRTQPKVEERSGQSGIGAPLVEYLSEVLRAPRTARSDYRNTDRF